MNRPTQANPLPQPANNASRQVPRHRPTTPPAKMHAAHNGLFPQPANGKPIREKSIPLERCLSILDDVDAAVISFQRELEESDRKTLLGRFEQCTLIISDSKLNATDQADLVSEIRGLDCMVTISTTTAHIAACLGVPVVLLAARREKQQWFWRAQAEHNKCFYPHLDVILGSEPNKSGAALLGKLDRRPRRAT